MKRSILRMICACGLMLLAMTAVAVIFAAEQQENTVYAWQRVKFSTSQEVRLFDASGKLLQTLSPQGGQAVSKLLPEGSYYAICGELSAAFFLHSNRTVTMQNGCGWAEDNVVHFTAEPVGSIRTELIASREIYEFCIIGDGFERRKTVYAQVGQDLTCEFLGIPYGSYRLYCNGIELTALTLDAKRPNQSVSLIPITN
ncbi:MAG: hypothetical protein E7434_02620 [Ruminococcaceae bacterium]|nr:hypothetical protein [Oscillospiraceae bacterium]